MGFDEYFSVYKKTPQHRKVPRMYLSFTHFKSVYEAFVIGSTNITADDLVFIYKNVSVYSRFIVRIIFHNKGIPCDAFSFILFKIQTLCPLYLIIFGKDPVKLLWHDNVFGLHGFGRRIPAELCKKAFNILGALYFSVAY